MANHHKSETSTQDIEQAKVRWHNFVEGGKYAIIFTCLILIGLALAFVKFT